MEQPAYKNPQRHPELWANSLFIYKLPMNLRELYRDAVQPGPKREVWSRLARTWALLSERYCTLEDNYGPDPTPQLLELHALHRSAAYDQLPQEVRDTVARHVFDGGFHAWCRGGWLHGQLRLEPGLPMCKPGRTELAGKHLGDTLAACGEQIPLHEEAVAERARRRFPKFAERPVGEIVFLGEDLTRMNASLGRGEIPAKNLNEALIVKPNLIQHGKTGDLGPMGHRRTVLGKDGKKREIQVWPPTATSLHGDDDKPDIDVAAGGPEAMRRNQDGEPGGMLAAPCPADEADRRDFEERVERERRELAGQRKSASKLAAFDWLRAKVEGAVSAQQFLVLHAETYPGVTIASLRWAVPTAKAALKRALRVA
jgi:hypothetical protein